MKLSKTQLKKLIGCSGGCDWDGDPYKEEKYEHFKSSVLNSLWDGTLEIEGYERVQWTKFDPNDPKTLPPKNKDVLFTDGSGVAFGYMDENKRVFSWIPEPTHWRPLPKPPTEQEVKK